MGTGPQGEANWQAVLARLDDLEQDNAGLREEVAALRSAQMAAPPSTRASVRTKRPGIPRTSRRRLFQLGGAAAAATVGAGVLLHEHSGTALAAPQHVASAPYEGDGSGSGNFGLAGVGTSGAIGVIGTSDSNIAVSAQSSTGTGVWVESTFGYGVYVQSASLAGVYAQSINSYGVYGRGVTGVYGLSIGGVGVGVLGSSDTSTGVSGTSTSGIGVEGTSNSGPGVKGISGIDVGGSFDGNRAPLLLVPKGVPGAPTLDTHNKGEVYLDSSAVVWVCVSAGSPGTWVRLPGVTSTAAGGAMNFLPGIARIVGAGNPPGVQLNVGSPQSFPIAGQGGIPSNATGVFGNATVYGSSGTGFIAVYPAGTGSSGGSLNFTAGDEPLSNFVATGLGTGGQITVATFSANCKFIYDAVGYTL
jgi:hypothetical protein